MSKLEKFGGFVLFLLAGLFLAAGIWVQYDYFTNVRPQALKLNEVMATTQDKKNITRIDLYDAMMVDFVKQQQKGSNVPATPGK
jgi:hypothetical protein